MSKILLPNIIKNLLIFIQVTIDNVEDVFSGFFVYFNTYFAWSASLGSAKAYIGKVGILNGHLIASCVRNIRTENYQNLSYSRKCRGCFFETECRCKQFYLFSKTSKTNRNDNQHFFRNPVKNFRDRFLGTDVKWKHVLRRVAYSAT